MTILTFAAKVLSSSARRTPIASCDSLCLDPYGFVSDCLECLSSSLAPHCGFLLSAVRLGFHVTGSIITPRRLAPLQLSYRFSVRAMHQLRIVDVSWHPDWGIDVQHRTPFGDASLLSAVPLRTLSFEFSGLLQLRLDSLLIRTLPFLVRSLPGQLCRQLPLQDALAANAPAGARRSSQPR